MSARNMELQIDTIQDYNSKVVNQDLGLNNDTIHNLSKEQKQSNFVVDCAILHILLPVYGNLVRILVQARIALLK